MMKKGIGKIFGFLLFSLVFYVMFEKKGLAAELDYSSLPMFYYSSGTGEWETELAFSGDGSFEGKYYKEESDKTGNGYLLGTRKEADLNGQATVRIGGRSVPS